MTARPRKPQKSPAALQKAESAKARLAKMELLVRSGRPVGEIAIEMGVSKGRVSQLTTAHGWTRGDITDSIRARAMQKVEAGAVPAAPPAAGKAKPNDFLDQETAENVIEVNAQFQARIILDERADIAKARGIGKQLLNELEAENQRAAAPATPKKEGPKVMPLVGRIDCYRKLADAMHKILVLERVVGNITPDTPIDPAARVAEAIDNGLAGLREAFDKKLGRG